MQVFSIYGSISSIEVIEGGQSAIVTYDDILSSFMAKLHLNNKRLSRDKALIKVTYIKDADFSKIANQPPASYSTGSRIQSSKGNYSRVKEEDSALSKMEQKIQYLEKMQAMQNQIIAL